MATSFQSIFWVEGLASQEAEILAGSRSSIDLGKAKQSLLHRETANFSREIAAQLLVLVKCFNSGLMEKGLVETAQGISFSRSRTSQGALLHRNGIQLVIESPSSGILQFRCERTVTEPTQTKASVLFSGIIEAEFGGFGEVEWTFLGKPISTEQVASHALTEFVQVSRPPR